MRSKVVEEFLALCNAKHLKGAAYTPHHQGLGERGHQVVTTNHLVLMSDVCKAFPQEWPAMLPVLEY
eukprot:9964640-Alexandrium_andersonii.AAC.1